MANVVTPSSFSYFNNLFSSAKTESDALPGAASPLKASTRTELNTFQPIFAAAYLAVETAEGSRGGTTTSTGQLRKQAVLHLNEFYKTFNNGIRLNFFSSNDRNYYGLDLHSDRLPNLDTDERLKEFGDRLLSGDTARVTAGGRAMDIPTAAEADDAYQAWKATTTASHSSIVGLKQAQDALKALLPRATALNKELLKDLRYYYGNLDDRALRGVLQTWGYRIYFGPHERPELHVSGTLAPGEVVQLFEGQLKADLKVKLVNRGPVGWEIGMAISEDGGLLNPHQVPNEQEQIVLGEVLGNLSLTHLLIHNPSTDQQAVYEVSFE